MHTSNKEYFDSTYGLKLRETYILILTSMDGETSKIVCFKFIVFAYQLHLHLTACHKQVYVVLCNYT